MPAIPIAQAGSGTTLSFTLDRTHLFVNVCCYIYMYIIHIIGPLKTALLPYSICKEKYVFCPAGLKPLQYTIPVGFF